VAEAIVGVIESGEEEIMLTLDLVEAGRIAAARTNRHDA
jgi:hypothetical protein